jgi:glycerol-3-phosphate acyltransferase PlsY
MTMSWWLIPAAYLLGSVSFSLLLVTRLEQQDLRQLGSGNAGATNVLRVAGKGPAALTLVLDIAKGAFPVWLGLRLEASGALLGATALAVVLGHIYPVFHGFRGGKGVATTVGALGVLQPTALAVSGVVFLVVVLATRYVSLASILGVTTYPIVLTVGLLSGLLRDVTPWMVPTAAAIAVLVVWKHRENLERLRRGCEPHLGDKGRSG